MAIFFEKCHLKVALFFVEDVLGHHKVGEVVSSISMLAGLHL